MDSLSFAYLWQAMLEHLWLSALSLAAAIVIAVPLAVWLAEKRRPAELVLQGTGVLQTIPSLALLGLLIPLVGIGSLPVLIALTLYALLPIFQNTLLGLRQIDPAIKEAHTAFGLSRAQALARIELPMALPAIISGIRTAAVLVIGTATLAALIGAGGLGNLILLGIDRNDMVLTFTGAALAAVLAVLMSAFFAWLQASRHKVALLGALLLGLGALLLGLGAIGLAQFAAAPTRQTVVVAGKMGSEPELLIHMYKLLIEQHDPQLRVEVKPNFGKTAFLFNALNSGDIDIYPEFTGTVLETLVQVPPDENSRALSQEETYQLGARLLNEQFGMRLLPPMAYENTYALAVPQSYAAAHRLQRISDLARVQNSIRAGFTLEFMNRQDGYLGLQRHGIRFAHVVSLEPALRYTALDSGHIDLLEAFSTDSELRQYHLTVLQDDIALFPHYQGAPLMKAAFAEAHPGIVQALNVLTGHISAEEMSEMNYRVKAQGESAATVAKEYLQQKGWLTQGK